MKKRAFSLIELSIVILIIGIIIAGITQSSRLVAQFRLSTARTLTNSSAVNSIPDLALWYEATSENSFKEVEADDGESLTAWYDINPQLSEKHDGTQASSSYEPTYLADCLNDLPCVSFSSGAHFDFDGSILVGTDFTIFIVEKRLTSSNRRFLGGSSSTRNQRLVLGYADTDTLGFSFYSNSQNTDVDAYSSTDPHVIDTFTHNGTQSERSLHRNGTNFPLSDSSAEVDLDQHLEAYPDAVLGAYENSSPSSYAFNGYIGEFIVFTRALKTAERQAVEAYLGKKWGLDVAS